MSGMGEFFDWVFGINSPIWVGAVVIVTFVVVMLIAIGISIHIAITTGFGWLVLGAWVFFPTYAVIRAYERSKK